MAVTNRLDTITADDDVTHAPGSNAESVATFQLPASGEMGFFAIPENRQLLQQISEKYPGGESGVFYRKTKPDEILFEYYILKR